MSEIVLQTSLSMEEIEKNFEGFDFFAALKDSLSDAINFEEGNPVPGTMVRYRSTEEKTQKWPKA